MLMTNVIGAGISIGCIVALLPRWLTSEGGRFDLIFGFTAICFGIATVISMLLTEPKDNYQEPPVRLRRLFWDVAVTLRDDRRFLRLTIIGALFSSSVMLFPHYQAIGRGDRMELQLTDAIWWIVIQNVGTATFSLFLGPLADRRGNRSVLRLILPTLAAAPLLALALSYVGPASRPVFPLVFILVGLVPVTLRIMHNYTLEMAEPPDHPRYLSAINLVMAAPILLSPFLGWLIDLFGFDPVFLGIALAIGVGWVMTYGLYEPRHAVGQSMTDAEVDGQTGS
jgi:MFS family permease